MVLKKQLFLLYLKIFNSWDWEVNMVNDLYTERVFFQQFSELRFSCYCEVKFTSVIQLTDTIFKIVFENSSWKFLVIYWPHYCLFLYNTHFVLHTTECFLLSTTAEIGESAVRFFLSEKKSENTELMIPRLHCDFTWKQLYIEEVGLLNVTVFCKSLVFSVKEVFT